MPIQPRSIEEFHVFLASPADVSEERRLVRQFFERYNRTIAQLWGVRLEVVDWENYSTIGIGRPQELITQQTLEKYRSSLVLVIGIMGQRFGSRTGKAESGTEEEFNWAMDCHHKNGGFPEIKWFFRKIDNLQIPVDPEEAVKGVEQWKKVLAFRKRMQDLGNPVFYTEYPGLPGFRDVFENDLQRWLADPLRPWVPKRGVTTTTRPFVLSPPTKYYENIEHSFGRLDIAGIDNDRTFEIPLSEVYVRLRVMLDEGAADENEAHESGPIDIQTALLRYPKLVIVGDPGSGKSTFLKYIALMLSRSMVSEDPGIALEKLCLSEPLPVPIFLSCWDLADFLSKRQGVQLQTLIAFIADRLTTFGYTLSAHDVEKLLGSGRCCLLFDGLDEVPTDAGRAAVSRLMEDCVQQYAENRYVITSRIRAYTGDTILKGEFTRCDIQPFDESDRAEFIRNWVSLLFRILPKDVNSEAGEAWQEFRSLTRGIEEKDRIRTLAVNPLLLTVIAIVHWNRKRLPEQRVDLYDECIDVLLGQRKQAEHIQLARKTACLDEQLEEQTHEERAWVRKRFAEIALHILSQDGEHNEAMKGDIIKLLAARFIDQGAANKEQAADRAALFLERQELRSGLLVSRRTQSYRFVHLTFQEFLAAWHLSNMEFDAIVAIIRSRLRLAKWFECLQLLGAQWAKESDEKADRYVEWLLTNCGVDINEQAPVVALCASIVKDISGLAELKPETRRLFERAVERTLDAFRKGSGVPEYTQLEILEALGRLGPVVKSHLIDATTSGLFRVRRRAIEMLLPHLSNDELFGMDHVLSDRSREPIKKYLSALLERDEQRAKAWLLAKSSLSGPAASAVLTLPRTFLDCLPQAMVRKLVESRVDSEPMSNLRITAAEELATQFPDKETRNFLCRRAQTDDSYVQTALLRVIVKHWPDENTRKLLAERTVMDEDPYTRGGALEALADAWPDQNTRTFLAERAVKDEHSCPRQAALEKLAEKWPDESTRKLLAERAAIDEDNHPRRTALRALAEKWPDKNTRKLLVEGAVVDEDAYTRSMALGALADKWPDENTRKFLAERAVKDEHYFPRKAALEKLAEKWPDEGTRKLLAERAKFDGAAAVLHGKEHSDFGRRVFTQYCDGWFPYLDPGKPISPEHIQQTAQKAGVGADILDPTVRLLSAHMGWDITRGSA